MTAPPPHPEQNPFDHYRSKTRRRAIAGAAAVVVAIAATALVLWWRDPNRAIDEARPRLVGLRTQYCKVYEKEAARPGGTVRAPSGAAAVRGLGYYFLDMKLTDWDEHPDENMDTIELVDLEALCRGATGRGSTQFSSQLVKVLAPNAGDGARLDTTRRLLAATSRVKYLFVARVTSFRASTAVGADGLSPGHFAGSGAVYKLDDASVVAAVAIDEEAPGFATVYGRQDPYGGGVVQQDVEGSLSAQTSLAFDDSFAHAFEAQGLPFKMR